MIFRSRSKRLSLATSGVMTVAAIASGVLFVSANQAQAQTAGCPFTGALTPSSSTISIGSVQGVTNGVPTSQAAPSPFPSTSTREELAWSPLYGQTVTVQGIVTAVTTDSSKGFYIQDCGDGNPDTSDGLFIFTGSTSAPPEQLGDVVQVTGRVGAFFGQTQISQSAVSSRIKKGTASLPAPVEIDVPSNVVNPDALLYFERLEGMRVRLSSPRITGAAFRLPGSSAETTTFYAVDSDDASELTGTGQLLVKDLGGGNVDYNPENIQIADDAVIGGGNMTQLTAAGAYPGMPPVQVGDTCTELVGVMNYSFSQYKVFPTVDPEATCTVKAKPAVGSASVRARTNGEVSVASFNVENFFPVATPLSSDPADACTSAPDLGPCYSAAELATKVSKLTLGIVDELRCPDVIGIEETYSESMLTGELIPSISARGCPYAAKSFPTHDLRGIEVGVMYRTDRGLIVDSIAKMPTQLNCGGTDPFLSPSAGREPLVASFKSSTGVAFSVIVNHWKSKGGDGGLFDQVQPPVRSTEDQRKCQAQAVRTYIDTLPTTTKLVVLGDFNDFSFPEPGEGADPITLLKGSVGAPLGLVEAADPGAYSYNFSGNSQMIDHIFVSNTLLPLKTGQALSPMNSDYGDVWRTDGSIAHGASDHNPDIVYLALEAPTTQVPQAAVTPFAAFFLGALVLAAVAFVTLRKKTTTTARKAQS